MKLTSRAPASVSATPSGATAEAENRTDPSRLMSGDLKLVPAQAVEGALGLGIEEVELRVREVERGLLPHRRRTPRDSGDYRPRGGAPVHDRLISSAFPDTQHLLCGWQREDLQHFFF